MQCVALQHAAQMQIVSCEKYKSVQGYSKICNLKLDSHKYCFSKTLSRVSESHWTLLCLVQYAIIVEEGPTTLLYTRHFCKVNNCILYIL